MKAEAGRSVLDILQSCPTRELAVPGRLPCWTALPLPFAGSILGFMGSFSARANGSGLRLFWNCPTVMPFNDIFGGGFLPLGPGKDA